MTTHSRPHILDLNPLLLLIIIRRPLPRLLKTSIQRPLLTRTLHTISRNQTDLEVSRDGHERALELVVVYVVGIRGLALAGYDAVAADDAHECCVEETDGDDLSAAGARAGAEGEVLEAGAGFFSGWVEGPVGGEPALWVEGCGVGTEVVDIY